MSAPWALIANGRARHLRRDPGLVGRLAGLLPAGSLVLQPAALEALGQAAAEIRAAGVRVLLVLGGDGTLHRVLTALHEVYGGAELPSIALLPAGNFNIVGWSVGSVGKPERVLRALLAAEAAGGCAVTRRDALRVEAGGAPQLGFLFGNGLISRFLEVYYKRPDAGPASAALDLLRGAGSALVGGPFAKELLRPWEGELQVDGVPWEGERFLTVAVGSVEQMGLGFQPFAGVAERPGELRVHAVRSSMAGLALDLPRAYLGRDLQRGGNQTAFARRLRLCGPAVDSFMLDGDFHHSSGEIVLSAAVPVRFLLPRPYSLNNANT